MTITQPYDDGRSRRHWGAALGAAALVPVVFAIAPALSAVMTAWQKAEYSHAWLIVPLAALVFMQRFAVTSIGGGRWQGVLIACLATVFLALGWLTRNTTFSIYGGIAGFYGLTWASVGARGMRTLTAPILFLVFIIPLPLAMYIAVSQGMQLLSSKIGVAIIGLLGITVYRDGNVIELANGRLEVAEACNGLRYLFPLLSISFLLSVMLDDRVWKKAVLFLSAFPIAIAMNALRLGMIGFLVDRYGMGMAEGTQHEVEGFAVFAVCVGLLLVEVNLLARVGQGGRFLGVDTLIPARATLSAATRWPLTRAFVLASVVLAGGAATVAVMPAKVEVIPDRRPLALFPLSFGDWRGDPHPLEAPLLASLNLTDYVMADYNNVAPDTKGRVNFYIAYYASQRFGVQVHSPRLCIPGEGWNIGEQTLVDIPVDDGPPITANRMVIEKRDVKQVVYYWFDERGRRLTHETEIKVFAIVDALWRDRSDGALVRAVAPVVGDDVAGADRNLKDFIRAMNPQIRKYIPS